MASYKEIVTKAVVGKGKKYFKNTYTIEATTKPSTVLGCWVINHKFKGYKTGKTSSKKIAEMIPVIYKTQEILSKEK